MPPPTCFLSFLLQSCHRQNIALCLKVPNFAGQLSRNMTYHMLSLSAYSKKMHGIALVLVYYTFEHYMYSCGNYLRTTSALLSTSGGTVTIYMRSVTS